MTFIFNQHPYLDAICLNSFFAILIGASLFSLWHIKKQSKKKIYQRHPAWIFKFGIILIGLFMFVWWIKSQPWKAELQKDLIIFNYVTTTKTIDFSDVVEVNYETKKVRFHFISVTKVNTKNSHFELSNDKPASDSANSNPARLFYDELTNRLPSLVIRTEK